MREQGKQPMRWTRMHSSSRRRGRREQEDVMSCLINLITWISNFKQEIKSNQHWAL